MGEPFRDTSNFHLISHRRVAGCTRDHERSTGKGKQRSRAKTFVGGKDESKINCDASKINHIVTPTTSEARAVLERSRRYPLIQQEQSTVRDMDDPTKGRAFYSQPKGSP